MQKAKEAAAETEAEGRRVLGFEGQRPVVELQLLEGLLEVTEAVGVRRKEAGEDHRLHLAVAGQCGRCSVFRGGDRVADPRIDDVLDRRRDVADLTGAQLLGGSGARREPSDLVHLVDLAGVHHPDFRARDDLPVDDADVGDHAPVRVVMRVEDQRTERRPRVASRRWHLADHCLEDVLGPDALLGRREDDLVARNPRHVGNFFGHHLGLGGVDLVDDRNQREAGLDCLVQIGESLRLDPLRRVDDEDRAFAGCQRT